MSTRVAACDFSKLSRAQIDALANVAFGGKGAGCGLTTLHSLEDRGLVEPHQSSRPSALGTFYVTEWSMGLATHIDFCRWCDKETPDDEVSS